eukprot:scaffold224040_cov31-Tisochrysis_lutea.AAC.6
MHSSTSPASACARITLSNSCRKSWPSSRLLSRSASSCACSSEGGPTCSGGSDMAGGPARHPSRQRAGVGSASSERERRERAITIRSSRALVARALLLPAVGFFWASYNNRGFSQTCLHSAGSQDEVPSR